MAVTSADAGYQQTPTSAVTYELMFDVDDGQPALGVLMWCETANIEFYTDRTGSSSSPLTLVAGSEKIPVIDMTSQIRKIYVRGGGTAQLSWHVNIR